MPIISTRMAYNESLVSRHHLILKNAPRAS